MGPELALWLAFNVALPLSPVALTLFVGWLFQQEIGIFRIIRDGQVCFFCTTIIAAVFKDIFDRKIPLDELSMILFMLMILATFIYGGATTMLLRNAATSGVRIGWASIFLGFATTVVVVLARQRHGLL